MISNYWASIRTPVDPTLVFKTIVQWIVTAALPRVSLVESSAWKAVFMMRRSQYDEVCISCPANDAGEDRRVKAHLPPTMMNCE
jgi:hypothetical protein